MKEKLKKLLEKSYSPYSNYPVAAIVVMKDGQAFEGVNVENASYGATICAERSAILASVSSGYRKGDFETLYVMVKSGKIAFPCFLCRQLLTEFFDMDAELILMNETEEQHYQMADILVHPFGPEDLK